MGFFEWLFGAQKPKRLAVRDSRPAWDDEPNDVLERAMQDPSEKERWKRSRLKDAHPDRLRLPLN